MRKNSPLVSKAVIFIRKQSYQTKSYTYKEVLFIRQTVMFAVICSRWTGADLQNKCAHFWQFLWQAVVIFDYYSNMNRCWLAELMCHILLCFLRRLIFLISFQHELLLICRSIDAVDLLNKCVPFCVGMHIFW